MSIEADYSDTCPRVVVMLDPKTRVIECADGIQWAMQTRYNKQHHPWVSQLWFRSKAGLLFYTAKPPPEELLALPDWFPEGRASAEVVTDELPSARAFPVALTAPSSMAA